MWKIVVASLLIVAPACAQESGTAYEALRIIGAQLGRGSMHHVISVTGVDGNPQPARWKVLVADESVTGGLREIDVADGRIVSDRPARGAIVGSTPGATIDTSKLNLDSSGAYAVANHTADTSHVVFDSVSYTLRSDSRGIPTWIVTLEVAGRQPVGTIHIAANRGKITRVEGMYQGTNMQQVETERTIEQSPPDDQEQSDEDADDADENIIKRRVKEAFRRTRRDAERMFQRVQESFDNFLDRHR